MKIKFTKLPTTEGTIKVSLDGGNSFKDYNIADIYESGITLSDYQDYEKIQIQAPANVLKNLNVVSSVKVDDGSSSGEEYETYTEALLCSTSDYGNLYLYSDNIFSSDTPEMFIHYDNTYHKFTNSLSESIEPSFSENTYVILNGETISVCMNFYISDGKVSSDDDPEGLVNIITYEKGVGGTATIKGVEVNYKTDKPQFSGDYDFSRYYWDSPDISDTELSHLYVIDGMYKTGQELRDYIINNDPNVYTRTKNGHYIKLPIKLY